MAKKVVIDEEECIGCGSCESICPEVFVLDEESQKAKVLLAEGGPVDQINEAIEACPVECIRWE